MLQIETQAAGPFMKNGFVVACTQTHEAVLIDPGDEVAGLLVAGWWLARRDGDSTRMAAAIWAPLGTLLAVAVNQPIVALAHEPRPYATLPVQVNG